MTRYVCLAALISWLIIGPITELSPEKSIYDVGYSGSSGSDPLLVPPLLQFTTNLC